jgi:hypothetical protein
MNFMQLLNSLDELLYEVMSWLVFFPITLWRTFTRPLKTMEYADRELHEGDDQQYEDALSPPLFLLLALLLSHGLEIVLRGDSPVVRDNSGLAALIGNDTSLLMLRLAVFSIIPLLLAVSLLVGKQQRITRPRLRSPFYAQCYPAAPFALMVGITGLMLQSRSATILATGFLLMIVTFVAYFTLQVFWFRHHLNAGILRALAHAVAGFAVGLTMAVMILMLFQ